MAFQCQSAFKNGTDGNLGTAINAMQAASSGRRMGISREGEGCTANDSRGNPKRSRVILRGGKQTNYDSVSVHECEQAQGKIWFRSGVDGWLQPRKLS